MSEMRFKSKLNGLMSMKGYWIKSIVVFLILALLSFGISQLELAFRNILNVPLLAPNGYPNYSAASILIEVIATLVEIIIMSPLIIGTFEWFYNINSGIGAKIGDLFVWFGSGKMFLKSMCLSLNIFIRAFLWGILLFSLPTFLSIYGMVNLEKLGTDFSSLSVTQTQTLVLSSLATFFSFFLFLGFLLLYLLIVSKYIPAFYLFIEDKNIKTTQAVKTSIRYTKGKRWEYTKFIFSFIGWFISCVLILPIIYVFPYFFSSLTVFSKSLIYSARNKENTTSNDGNDMTKKFDAIRIDNSTDNNDIQSENLPQDTSDNNVSSNENENPTVDENLINSNNSTNSSNTSDNSDHQNDNDENND